MSTDLYDDVAAPHFEDRLWQELAATHAAVKAGSYTPPAEPRPRRPRRRRNLLVATAAIASVAATVAAVVVIRGGGDHPTPDPGTRTGTPEEAGVDLAAEISQAEQEAAADSIVHIHQDSGGHGPQYNYDTESWYDETSGWRRDLLYGLDGQPSHDSGAATAPSVDEPSPPPIPPDAEPFDPSLPTRRIRTVDYCFSQYTETDQTALPGGNSAEDIGAQLAEGTLIEDGTEVVDGRELIRLVETLGSIGADDTTRIGSDSTYVAEGPPVAEVDPNELLAIVFVDPETYRPVMRVGYPGVQPDYSDATYVMTFEYLPRTPENMAQFVAPVPAGFEQVEQLRSDGERADAGC